MCPTPHNAPKRGRASGHEGACRLPIHAPSSPPFPTRQFHVKHARIIPAGQHTHTHTPRIRHAPGLTHLRAPASHARSSPLRCAPARAGGCASVVSPHGDDPYATHVFHVKHASANRPSPLARPAMLLSCPRGERSLSVQSPPTPAQLKMRRRTHSPTVPSP